MLLYIYLFWKIYFIFLLWYFKYFYITKYVLPIWKRSFFENLPRNLYKRRKNVFCIMLFTYQLKSRGFSLFGKDFLSAIERLINSNERKLGPPWFVLFCLEFRRFYITLVPVSRKNVLFFKSIVSIKLVVFWCDEKKIVCYFF